MKIKDIWYYIQGNIRYRLYYSKYFSWLIREHIYQQIDFRIDIMNPKCFMTATCVLCGCKTTALQMADKSCDKPCYPPMTNKENWELLKKGQEIEIKGDIWKIAEGTVSHGFGKKKTRISKVYKNNKKVHVKEYE